MKIMVEEEGRTKGWVFHHRKGYRMKTSDMDKGFQKGLGRVNLEEVVMIHEGVDVGEYISLRRLFRG